MVEKSSYIPKENLWYFEAYFPQHHNQMSKKESMYSKLQSGKEHL